MIGTGKFFLQVGVELLTAIRVSSTAAAEQGGCEQDQEKARYDKLHLEALQLQLIGCAPAETIAG